MKSFDLSPPGLPTSWGGILLVLLFSAPLFAVDTTIKGGSMELLDKGEKVLFKNGVTLTRDGDTLKANEMETNKSRDRVKAKGNVRLFRRVNETQTLRGKGRKGFYDTTLGKGYLLGGFRRAHVIYTDVVSSTETRKMDIFAKRMDFFKDKSKAVAKKNVYGKTTDPQTGELYEFWAEKGEYFGDEKKVVLTGKKQPRVRQSKEESVKQISGDVIIYYIDSKQFIADGNAVGHFVDPKKEAEEKE